MRLSGGLHSKWNLEHVNMNKIQSYSQHHINTKLVDHLYELQQNILCTSDFHFVTTNNHRRYQTTKMQLLFEHHGNF